MATGSVEYQAGCSLRFSCPGTIGLIMNHLPTPVPLAATPGGWLTDSQKTNEIPLTRPKEHTAYRFLIIQALPATIWEPRGTITVVVKAFNFKLLVRHCC